MSKYTVSTLDSVGNLNNDDLLLVSTIDENGEYASKNITFGSIAQLLNSNGSSGNSTGNNTTDLINFFTPRSHFKTIDAQFIDGSSNAVILLKPNLLTCYTLKQTISCCYSDSGNLYKVYNINTPVTDIPIISTVTAETSAETRITAYIDKNNINCYTYNNFVSADTTIKDLFVLHVLTAPTSTDTIPDNSHAPSVEFNFIVDSSSDSATLQDITYYFYNIEKFNGNKYLLNISNLEITATNLRKYISNGYKYILARQDNLNNNVITCTTNRDEIVKLSKVFKNIIDNDYKQILSKGTSAAKLSVKNSIVYTTEVPITDSCIAYIHASFTCDKTALIGEAYCIELQIQAPTISETWFPIYRLYAIVDNSGRTSMNYQLYAQAGIKLRGKITPTGNAGNIYYNYSLFSVTLCKTDGEFLSDDAALSIQLLTILYKNSNSNILYLTNTYEEDNPEKQTDKIVGRWISLNGNFSIYGYYRRANIDVTNNMYMLLKKIEYGTNEISSESDTADNTNVGSEATDVSMASTYLPSPIHTTPNVLSASNNSNITFSPHKIPFHTVVLNNKNNNYTSYEYFVPAETDYHNNDTNNTVNKYKYGILLMATNTLGNNSAFKSYGPNTAIINKTIVRGDSNIPTIPANSNDSHPRSTFIFHPIRRRLIYSFNNNYRRDAAVGIYSIKQTSKQDIDIDNLAELELFTEISAGKYYYDNVFERIAGATQLYYCAVNPVATTISSYTAYQANIVFNDIITSFAVSNKTAGYAKNVAKCLTFVPHIAESVEGFDDYCFYECVNLKQMPDYELSVTSLGNYCFYNCKSLTGELKLNHVTQINGTHIFAECLNLNAIEMSAFNGEIPKNFAYKCNSLTHIDLQSTTSIAEYAFKKTGLMHINNSTTGITNKSNFNKVKKIGKYAFTECTSLSDVKLSSCNSIDSYAFYKCNSLTSLNLQDCTNIEIGTNAFYGCPLSGNIYLGNVSIINAGAFSTADRNNAVFILDNTNATELPTLKSTSAFPNNVSSYKWKIQVKTEAMKSAMEYDRIWRSFKNRIIVETKNNNAQSST